MHQNNQPEDYYSNLRSEMLEFLPDQAFRIMDIGCGNGAFGSAILETRKAEVWGIELLEKEAVLASKSLHKVLSGPVEEHLESLPDSYFDVVYCNDVLEHLSDPYEVLRKLKYKLKPGGKIISSIPNIRYHNVLVQLLVKKDWKYEKFGVMDQTHLRFFTGKSIRRMYEDLGFNVVLNVGINMSKSIKPYLYNIPIFFTALDIRYPQFATVAIRPLNN